MNNPFLVCCDRDLSALPTQWQLAERWDEAGYLLKDLEFRDAKVRRLGIDELLQDSGAALRLLPEENDWRSRLATIKRMLDLESYHLRDWDSNEQPGFFL